MPRWSKTPTFLFLGWKKRNVRRKAVIAGHVRLSLYNTIPALSISVLSFQFRYYNPTTFQKFRFSFILSVTNPINVTFFT
jgi:hypothetical protein